MPRSGLMGSCLMEVRALVHEAGQGSGRMGDVAWTKPVLKAVWAFGPEGVSLMVSWSWRHGAHWISFRRGRSCF
jgi:hypothetical protein